MRKQGFSKDKVCKGTDIPKRAGNFSPSTIHRQSLVARDYRVSIKDGNLIVGEGTLLTKLFEPMVVAAIQSDPYFREYRQHGVKTINGKQYEAHRILTKFETRYAYLNENVKYILREEIYTDFDFEWNFNEY